MKVSYCVNEAAEIHKEIEMSKKVSTDYCVFDVSEGKNPWKRSSKTEVEGERSCTVGSNCGGIGYLEIIALAMFTVVWFRWSYGSAVSMRNCCLL